MDQFDSGKQENNLSRKFLNYCLFVHFKYAFFLDFSLRCLFFGVSESRIIGGWLDLFSFFFFFLQRSFVFSFFI